MLIIPWTLGLFSLIFLKRKGATVSKVLEKRESIVCYIKFFCAVGYAEELIRKITYKAVFCARSDGSMVLPYL